MQTLHEQPHSNYGTLSSKGPGNDVPRIISFRKILENRSWIQPLLVSIAVAIIITVTLLISDNRNHIRGNNFSDGVTVPVSATDLEPLTKPKYHLNQRVDHFDPTDDRTWSHPYFVSEDYFAGPGSPILVILGGEGPVKKILYPFVSKKLASVFGAYVLQTEHRFYGASQPIGEDPTTMEMMQLFTPEQAIADNIQIIQSLRQDLGCSLSKSSSDYCPVVTIGASYPGFLSAIMRHNFADIIDVGYAASAPMVLNAHHSNANTDAYFNHVSTVAETARPGCARGTWVTLKELHRYLFEADIEGITQELGICHDTIPEYMKSSRSVFAREMSQLVVNINADANMEYYPPSENTLLVKLCKAFTDKATTAQQRYASFLLVIKATEDYTEANPIRRDCFDLQTQLPDGPNATISSADWTGVGAGQTGSRWGFQVCKDLVIKTGYADRQHSMFYPPRKWTLEWLTQHCQNRFGTALTPEPGRLNKLWNFDNLEGASRILFTNGNNDGWSVGSFTQSSSDSIVVMNFPNGSHHSDLTHQWPREDTDDIVQGHAQIVEVLRNWL